MTAQNVGSTRESNNEGLDPEGLLRRLARTALERLYLPIKVNEGRRTLQPILGNDWPWDGYADSTFRLLLRFTAAPKHRREQHLQQLSERAARPLHPKRFWQLRDEGLDIDFDAQDRGVLAVLALRRAFAGAVKRRSGKPWRNALNEVAEELVRDHSLEVDTKDSQVDAEDEALDSLRERAPRPEPRHLAQLFEQELLETVDATPKERVCWRLRREGYSNAEIGEQLEIQPDTVAGYLSRLRSRLRDAL